MEILTMTWMAMTLTQAKEVLNQMLLILKVRYQCSIKKMRCKEREWLKDKKNCIKIE